MSTMHFILKITVYSNTLPCIIDANTSSPCHRIKTTGRFAHFCDGQL